MITASVMTVTTRRVVELMPRLTHHSSAQLITTGTMISSCNTPRLVGSARTAGAAYSDADSTTDLHAGVGAVELDETRTIGGARIAGAGTLQRQQPARGHWFVRLLTAGRLGRRGRQHRNGDRKEDVSHPLLIIGSELSMLPDELDADRLAAAPDYVAVAPCSGVARERHPEAARQHDGVLRGDFRPRFGQILHDALACREATFEGDPSGLAQRFARVPRLYFCVHFSCSSAYSRKSGYRFYEQDTRQSLK